MTDILDWLMDGDPAIRWQVMRDLLGEPQAAWQAERRRTLTEGWGARFLSLQAEDASWGGGIYSPKWISTWHGRNGRWRKRRKCRCTSLWASVRNWRSSGSLSKG